MRPALLLSALLAGCVPQLDGFGAEDAPAPELQEGQYLVVGELESETCGAGELRPPQGVASIVAIEVEGEAIRYDAGGEPLVGEIAEDGAFVVASEITIDLRGSADTDRPPCSITRTDTLRATLAPDQERFEGRFEIDYQPTPGSDCFDLTVGAGRLATALPCRVRYAVVGDSDPQ